jgi:Raf kinase inhibitor-like YbhB/YbcL family protein
MRFSPRSLAPCVSILLALAGAEAAHSQVPLGDAARGKMLFQQSCALCHASGVSGMPQGGQGPVLAGVVGRPAGNIASFGYTRALATSHLTWDAATLDRFLAGPGMLVPGTTMPLPVPDAGDRRDIIAFLGTLGPITPPESKLDPSNLQRISTPGDWQNDAPGVRHRVRVEDLPAPFATKSAGNTPHVVDQPPGAVLSVPAGFRVKFFASDPAAPRLLRTAPNGDIFIADTHSGQIRVLRTVDGADAPALDSVFAKGLRGPFGIAFYPLGPDPQWVYVGNLNSVVRFPYHNGDLAASGPAQTVVPRLADSTGGHSTRDVAFSLDGRRMFISVGSGSNVAEGLPTKTPDEIRDWESAHALGAAWGYETNRADVLVTDPEGHAPLRPFATGIRNAVGIAVQAGTGDLWVSVNERDALGDDLVPDYVTRVREGGYYGWPWYYMGNHEDPRHAGERPDLAGKTIIPDVPEQAHSASLQMTFYPADASGPAAFPAEYRGDIFVAFHGSWNRTGRTGGKIVRVLLKDGVATGEYEDFLTGWVVDDSHMWGRPVGVTVAHDGALLVTEDGNNTIWRVSYVGGKPPSKPGLTLTTPAFEDSGLIPAQFTQNAATAPISPPLEWTNVPANTVSFALIMHDPEGAPKHRSEDNLHWMAFNIPGTARSLPAAIPALAVLPDGTVQTKNIHGTVGYLGPGAGAAGPLHHYTWELYALDIRLDLTPDATRADVLKAMDGHVLGKGVLAGRFHR